ncbi:MAG: hypothetical protein JRJ00_00255 [Deltaproteobacteria bacterium]|nr:hypothetical protein [Deltaproteobacteria bacterium]
MATVNQIVSAFLKSDSDMASAFNGVFYLINDNEVKASYATYYMIDDPQDKTLLCPTNQGQARFACDVFAEIYDDGVDKRQIYMDVMKKLEATTTSGLNIWSVENINVSDRSTRVNGLFMFSFESILKWEN